MDIQNIIPDPTNRESGLAEVEKRIRLIQEKLRFPFIKVAILPIVAIFLVASFQQYSLIIVVLFSTHFIWALVDWYIVYLATKSISRINVGEDQGKYRDVVIKGASIDLIRSIVRLISVASLVVVSYTFFSNELHGLLLKFATGINASTYNLQYLLYILIIVVTLFVSQVVIDLIRLNLFKRIRPGSSYAEISKEVSIINREIMLIYYIPVVAIIVLLILSDIISVYILFSILALLILFFIISLWEIKRLKKITFEDNPPLENPLVIKTAENEKIEAIICGIMRVNIGFKDFVAQYLNQIKHGKTFFSENTLVVTTARLLFLQIPVSVNNEIIDNNEFTSKNFFFNRGEIENNAKKIIENSTIDQLSRYVKNDIKFDSIRSLELNQYQIRIEKNTDEKIKYGYIDPEYTSVLKSVLSNHLESKFISDL